MPVTPGSDELALNGQSLVTFGPASVMTWQGNIKAPVTPRGEGWGDVDNLRTTLQKLSTLSFTDHYSNTYTVVVRQTQPEQSKTPMWDGASNEIAFPVEVKQVV